MNDSASFDRPVITFKKGVVYEFEEGKTVGNGQKYVSRAEFAREMLTPSN